MQTNEQLLSAIENYLAQTEFPAEPELLYAPIGYSLAGGGKRLRPMLLMLSNGIFTDKIQHALPAAAAVEVFHNFTLLHDDIMDNAAVRRGKPSVYAKVGAERGDPLGRRHDDLRLPVAGRSAGATAAADTLDVQHHGARSVRRAAVRHGFRTQTEGFGRGIHAHDRAEDLGFASRGHHDRRPAGRRFGGGLPQAAPLRHRTGTGIPAAGRPAGQLRRRKAGQGHRRRHPRRQTDLPDDHGHKPRGRTYARSAPLDAPLTDARRRENRHDKSRLRPSRHTTPHRTADFAALRKGAGHPRHPFGRKNPARSGCANTP